MHDKTFCFRIFHYEILIDSSNVQVVNESFIVHHQPESKKKIIIINLGRGAEESNTLERKWVSFKDWPKSISQKFIKP